MKSYFEEFEKKYNKPRMNEITVGFSGIDPAPKNESGSIDDSVAEYLSMRVASSSEVNAALDDVWDG